MLCPKCDTQNRDNAKFCKVCGYSFTAEDVAASKGVAATASDAQSATPSQEATPYAAASSLNEVAPSSPADVNEVAPQGAQVVEVVVQPEAVASAQSVQTPQPTQSEQAVQPAQSMADSQNMQSAQNTTLPEDDISLAPTQILSPQEMVAFQARRWQHEATDSSHPSADADAAHFTTETDIPHPIANEQPVPTASAPQQFTDGSASSNTIQTEVATTPTVTVSQNGDVVQGEPVQIPPPPPPEAQLMASGHDPNVSQYAEQASAPPASVTPPAQDATLVGTDSSHPFAPSTDSTIDVQGRDESAPTDNVSADVQGRDASVPTEVSSSGVQGQDASAPINVTSSDGQGQDASASIDTPDTLAVGTMVAGRYEIMGLVHADEQEHVYTVLDRQGYQQCWNCGSKENAEGDEFCIDCGAELLNANYLLHEYPATASSSNGSNDAHVLQGTIANTFVDGGKTYVIEQQHTAQLAFPNGVHIIAAGDSDAGNVRRSEPNEDSTLILQFQRVHESHATPIGVFIIADGMGGHDNGQGASRMAINVISDKVVRELLLPPLETEKSGGLTASVTPMEEDALVGVFKGAVEEANNMLVQTNQHDKTDMGSTLTGFMIVGDSAFIINVGDSRTYMLREDTLYQLTNDHSLVAQLLAGGLIEPDDVYTHPQRSQIFRSLGDKINVQIDDFKQQLLPGDILLSCSDGLWEMVRNPQITDILKNAHDPQTACTQLIEAANANGGEDNVSVVIAFVR